MAIFAEGAAKKICTLGSWNVTNLQLQKLLYLGHMIFMGRTNGAPLLCESFEAWDYGPVVPKIYRKVKMYGSCPVRDVFYTAGGVEGTPEGQMLDQIIPPFLQLPASELVAITHWEDGAWARHYLPGARGVRIPNEDILQEYRARVNAG